MRYKLFVADKTTLDEEFPTCSIKVVNKIHRGPQSFFTEFMIYTLKHSI
jgi:hypothetical protein